MLPFVREMSEIERTAGGVIVCGFDGVDAPDVVHRWLAQDTVAGLILFKRNIVDLEQTASLIASCRVHEDTTLPRLVSVDQEGGRVARFGEPMLKLPPMRTLAMASDPELTRSAAAVVGRQLRAVGVNLNFAPVLDVDTNPANPVIGDRSFGATPDSVIEQALAFAEGLHRGGVLCCGKHFPGHGDTDLDSHLALPVLRHARTRLEEVELRPFRATVGRLPSLMTAHVVFESIDPDVPATMSPKAIRELLREDVGFKGAVFSDDLEMKAVADRYSIEEAGVLAIEAGCDLLLVCSDLEGVDRLRERLVKEAQRSAGFNTRLNEARARADALRRGVRTLPPAASLQNALHGEQVRAVQRRLAELE